jgi:hypothetical protein
MMLLFITLAIDAAGPYIAVRATIGVLIAHAFT